MLILNCRDIWLIGCLLKFGLLLNIQQLISENLSVVYTISPSWWAFNSLIFLPLWSFGISFLRSTNSVSLYIIKFRFMFKFMFKVHVQALRSCSSSSSSLSSCSSKSSSSCLWLSSSYSASSSSSWSSCSTSSSRSRYYGYKC